MAAPLFNVGPDRSKTLDLTNTHTPIHITQDQLKASQQELQPLRDVLADLSALSVQRNKRFEALRKEIDTHKQNQRKTSESANAQILGVEELSEEIQNLEARERDRVKKLKTHETKLKSKRNSVLSDDEKAALEVSDQHQNQGRGFKVDLY